MAMMKMRMAMMAVAPVMEETVTRKSSVKTRTGRRGQQGSQADIPPPLPPPKPISTAPTPTPPLPPPTTPPRTSQVAR